MTIYYSFGKTFILLKYFFMKNGKILIMKIQITFYALLIEGMYNDIDFMVNFAEFNWMKNEYEKCR